MNVREIITDKQRGELIRRARAYLGWSQTRLAEEANQFTTGCKLTRGIVQAIEGGQVPTINQMNAIALASGQRLSYYNGGEFDPSPTPSEPKGFKLSQRCRVSPDIDSEDIGDFLVGFSASVAQR